MSLAKTAMQAGRKKYSVAMGSLSAPRAAVGQAVKETGAIRASPKEFLMAMAQSGAKPIQSPAGHTIWKTADGIVVGVEKVVDGILQRWLA